MSRSDDLAAGLAADLEAELALHSQAGAVETPPESPRQPATTRPAPTSKQAADPFAEAALYLSPRQWSLPRIGLQGHAVLLGAGPLRLRIGRAR